MEKYTEEQIRRANEVDLVGFLSAKGERLEKSGSEYRWKTHDSVTIRGNEWYRHSQGSGGGPINFLIEFYGMSFPDAVKELLGGEKPGEDLKEHKQIEHQQIADKGIAAGNEKEVSLPAAIPERPFVLPEKDENFDHIQQYLVGERKIGEDILKVFMDRDDVYQERGTQNVVFVGRDKEQKPRFACWRNAGPEKLRKDVFGSNKEYGFKSLAFWENDTEKVRTSRELYVFEAAIDMLSFITLFPKYWHERHFLALGGTSSKALMRLLAERQDIEQIYLCLDNDKAGQEASAKLLEAIPMKYAVTKLVPIKKDWNEVLMEGIAANEELYATQIRLRKSEKELVPVKTMSEFEATVVEWLWYPFIPFGKVTLIQGDPGQGKTWLAMQLAAACTNRKELPNELPMDPFNILYQTAEDGIGDTIKPRALLCGADMERVRTIVDDEKPLTLTDQRIEDAIIQNNAKLVILDPIQAYLGADVDMNRANEIRPRFRHLGRVAERTGAAIVLIGHLNKNSGTQANYRGLGSVDITAAVRSILLVGKVEKEKDRDIRVVIQTKSSLAPKPTPMAFTLENNKLEWIGEYEITEQDLMAGKAGKKSETKMEIGKKMIREQLTQREWMFTEDLNNSGKALNISVRTMRNAREALKEELEYKKVSGNTMVRMKK